MRRLVLFPVLAAALLLGACGSSEPSEASDSASTTVSADVVTDMDDLMFLTMMIPHHQQAVDMSALAADRAENEDVKALAATIGTAQIQEISQMTQWLDESGQPMSMPGGHSGHMAGMVSDEDMAKLKTLTGHDFDHEFLVLMIAHHEGAIDMAKQVLSSGESAKVRSLATAIDEVQRAEIRQMKAIIEEISQHDGH